MSIKKKRGVVLELNDDEMVLLTPEGEFVKRPVLQSAVNLGDEVFFTENIEKITPPKPKFLTKWSRSGLAVAAVLLLLVLVPAVMNHIPLTTETVAYVTIDVNPSVELGIDNKDQVVSVTGLNDDGTLLLQSLELIGKKSELAAELITTKMVELGYISRYEATELVITVRAVKPGNKQVGELKEKLAVTTKNALAKDEINYVVVQTEVIDEQLQLSAQVAGVSPGKYIYMLNKAARHTIAQGDQRDIVNIEDDSSGEVSQSENEPSVLEEEEIDAPVTVDEPDANLVEESKPRESEPQNNNSGSSRIDIASTMPEITNENSSEIGQVELDEEAQMLMLLEQLEVNDLEMAALLKELNIDNIGELTEEVIKELELLLNTLKINSELNKDEEEMYLPEHE